MRNTPATRAKRQKIIAETVWVIEKLKAAGLTEREIADEIGCSQYAVWNWVANQDTVPLQIYQHRIGEIKKQLREGRA